MICGNCMNLFDYNPLCMEIIKVDVVNVFRKEIYIVSNRIRNWDKMMKKMVQWG